MNPRQKAWRSMALGVVAALGMLACGGEDEVAWVVFNGPDDSLTLEVTAPVSADDTDVLDTDASAGDTEGGEDVASLEMTSTTGGSIVGTLTVDPASGPVGTLHRVEVRVDDAYEERVDRAELELDAGDRGVEVFSLTRDSADLGLWVLDIRSFGAPGEVRSDTLRVMLFEPDITAVTDDGDEVDATVAGK